jgi:hypothetical protein
MSGPRTGASLAVSELGAGPVSKPGAQAFLDLLLGCVRKFSLEVLPHQIDAGLE